MRILKIAFYTFMVLVSLGLGLITELCLSDAYLSTITLEYMNIAINIVVALCLSGLVVLLIDGIDEERMDYAILSILVFFSYIGFGFFINR